MTEELPLKEETAPTTEPLTTSGLPESDKKRVMIGTAIGGGIFLGVLITIIVLVSTEASKTQPPAPPPRHPVFPHYNPYFVFAVSQESERVIRVSLNNRRKELEGSNTEYHGRSHFPLVKATPENLEPENLTFTMTDMDEHLARFHYTVPGEPRWHVPYYGNHSDPYAQAAKYTHTQTGFKIQEGINDSFQWHYGGKVGRFVPLITTANCRFQYFDKYIEFEAILERDFIYGMGERIESFYLKNDNYSLWNRYYPYDVGGDTENGMYGSHPFILNRLTTDQRDDFIGLFMRNSNAMLFSMWDHLHNGTTINYKMVGGTIDLYLFHTADPQYILRKYHSLIGRPYLPAIWAMGLQQAREDYTIKEFDEIIKKHNELKIPIDALWADTILNDAHKTFTVSQKDFAGIKEFVNKMHSPTEGIDMHFVAIATPALLQDNSYKYYAEAVKLNCLIMSASHIDKHHVGRTSAGDTVWLDFFLYNSTLVWAGGLHDLYEATLFDGIWLSENEITNLCSGDCPEYVSNADAEKENYGIPNPYHNVSEFSYLQYRPTLDHLEADTLPMTAFHSGNMMYNKQFFTHNLFGLQLSRATFASLAGLFEDKRFLVASRATWPGSGQYASHWLAGNYATWDSMISSIAGILNFNMFGIPHVGAPIGGFYKDCDEELLIRWFELGAFYPLMLSYGSSNSNHKEAYAFPNAIPHIKNAIIQRYTLIRFMYTKIFEAHAWGGAVVHPLFFDFTNETELYTRAVLDRTFMWAHTLYVIPSLVPHQTQVNAFLPNWRWYNLVNGQRIVDYWEGGSGSWFTFEQPLGHITVLVKGGTIVPYQHLVEEGRMMNVKDLELIPARIVIAPDHTGKALGTMVVDNEGVLPHPDPKSNTYRHYTFTYMNRIFRINILNGFDFHGSYTFDEFWELLLLDVSGEYSVSFVCMMDMYMKKKELQFLRMEKSSALAIHDENQKKMSMYTLESIVWGTPDSHDFCKFKVHIASLELSDNNRKMTGTLESSDTTARPMKFDLFANAINNYAVYLKIANNDKTAEWKVPDIVSEAVKTTAHATRSLDGVGFGTSHKGMEFYFEMSEEDDPHDFLLTTRNQPFVYVKNFIQIKFMVAGRHIFGLGERVGKFELADGVYSIWNYDAMHEETGLPPGNNMYGSHPFYMVHTHNPRDFAGVFFLTSNPMDVRIKHIGMQTEIDHILSGGIVELFLLGKGPAELVLREYHNLIGKPTPLPFWAFGYHQSRWGYKDIMHLELLLTRFEEAAIPLDGVWMDKDFMKSYKSFTVDGIRWPGLGEFVKKLHSKGKHFVAIVDAGIAIDRDYAVYTRGLDRGVYIKSSFTKEPLVGITWAGYSVWVDYVNPASADFWTTCLDEFHRLVEFDGIWLDMNEPSNFCDGECPDKMTYHYYTFPLDYYDDLYYNPTHRPIEDNTVSMEALHAGDELVANEFNYHSLYGFYQSRVTAKYFESLQKRPFVISSATFPGTGKYAAHWLGDNYSSWPHMEHSIAGMLNFNLFGIPFVGANICGYMGNATEELCSRWMQLGAFYPFMRNHNSPDSPPQEPYVHERLQKVSKKAIQLRYSLVRYIYTEYMHTVLRGGSMIKPLAFLFPEDNETYGIIDTTFMIGPGLRVTPILEPGISEVTSYFPNADWYHFEGPDYKKILSHKNGSHKGESVKLFASLDEAKINLHIRSGTIVTTQEVNDGTTSILQVHKLPINLVVAPAPAFHHFAVGEILYDSEHHSSFVQDHQDIMMFMNGSTIHFNVTSGRKEIEYAHEDKFINKILILGATAFKDSVYARYDTGKQTGVNMKLNYNVANNILTLEAADTKSMNVLEITKIYWGK